MYDLVYSLRCASPALIEDTAFRINDDEDVSMNSWEMEEEEEEVEEEERRRRRMRRKRRRRRK